MSAGIRGSAAAASMTITTPRTKAFLMTSNVTSSRAVAVPRHQRSNQQSGGKRERSHCVQIAGENEADWKPSGAHADSGQHQKRQSADEQSEDAAQVQRKPDILNVPGENKRPGYGHHRNAQGDACLRQTDGVGQQPADQIDSESLQEEGDASYEMRRERKPSLRILRDGRGGGFFLKPVVPPHFLQTGQSGAGHEQGDFGRQ